MYIHNRQYFYCFSGGSFKKVSIKNVAVYPKNKTYTTTYIVPYNTETSPPDLTAFTVVECSNCVRAVTNKVKQLFHCFKIVFSL